MNSSHSDSGFDPQSKLNCDRCGDPLVERPAAPYPVAIQVVFAVSFVAFLCFHDRLRLLPQLMWGWTALQAGLAILLVRKRMAAKKRVYRCIRCDGDLSSLNHS